MYFVQAYQNAVGVVGNTKVLANKQFAEEQFKTECDYYAENTPRFDTTISIYDDELDCYIAQKKYEGYDIIVKREEYESLKKDYFLLKDYVNKMLTVMNKEEL